MTELPIDANIHSHAGVSMAESVTRHALITEGEKFRFLLCGIDTLDLGLFVSWGQGWGDRLLLLNSKKLAAQKENGGLLLEMPSGRKFIFHAGGKGNNYRFHIEFPEYHLFIGKASSPGKSPNVYVSLNSKTLWFQQIKDAIDEIASDIKFIGGGIIKGIQPSRCDMAADFAVLGGLSYEFLKSHKVTRSRKSNQYLNGDTLETLYVGARGGSVQLRIYDKAAEVLQEGKKLWFWELWGIQPGAEVWRVEFQLRRPVLKQYGISTLSDLYAKAGGMWKNLTEGWFSLRLEDNESTERRSFHPFWKEVQSCAGRFGPAIPLKRNLSGSNTASVDWYVSHMEGCLCSFAARLGIENREDALRELKARLSRCGNEKSFNEKLGKKAVSLGKAGNGGCK